MPIFEHGYNLLDGLFGFEVRWNKIRDASDVGVKDIFNIGLSSK